MIIVEDGTGQLQGANSYVSMDDANAYCSDHGLAFVASPSSLGEAALIRASIAIDARYANAYPGYRKNGRQQGLQWPRAAAYDIAGWLITDSEVPIEIIQATCEAAVRELADPNSMMPDLERGGKIDSIKAGSVGITWSSSASAYTTFTLIDGILINILSGIGNGGGLFGMAIRS